MSASWPGSMRGPRLKTPLLVLLLLLSTLTESVVCQDEEDDNTESKAELPEGEPDPELGADGDTTTPVTDTTPTPDPSIPENPDPDVDPGNEGEDTPSSGDDGKTSRSFEYYETIPSSTIDPGDVAFEPQEDPDLGLIIILVPVMLVILFIAMIVCGLFVNRRWKQKARTQELVKDDPYLDGSSAEKVPMPMFEEDVPSVLELEMEELDQWMKKDSVTADDCNHA